MNRNTQLLRKIDLFCFCKCNSSVKLFSQYFFAIIITMSIAYFTHFVACTKCFSMVKAVQISKIFPPKDLEKYGRPQYACAVFFFIFPSSNVLKVLSDSLYILFNTLIN